MTRSIAARLRPALAVSGLAMAAWAMAQGSNVVPGADRTFAQKAAAGGMAEVAAGQVAQQKAANDQVKQFGARMVQDHSKANDELKSIAGGKGLQLPAEPDAKDKKAMDKMQAMSGAQFDRAYMDHMVADHKKDIADFEKEANSGKDPELKAFAAKTLPTLRDHLKMATDAQAAARGGK